MKSKLVMMPWCVPITRTYSVSKSDKNRLQLAASDTDYILLKKIQGGPFKKNRFYLLHSEEGILELIKCTFF